MLVCNMCNFSKWARILRININISSRENSVIRILLIR